MFNKYKRNVEIVGVFPGRSYTSADYNSFQKKYGVQFILLTDTAKKAVRQMGASITPEVFLMDEKRVVVYQGAIDDWAISLGSKRNKVTSNYLEDAINNKLNHVVLKVKQTKAVGCLINDL